MSRQYRQISAPLCWIDVYASNLSVRFLSVHRYRGNCRRLLATSGCSELAQTVLRVGMSFILPGLALH